MTDDRESQDDESAESICQLLERRTEARIQAFLDQMESDYDSVVVFVTKSIRGENKTLSFNKGCGNVYASLAVTKEWLIKSDEDSKIDQREWRESARMDEEDDDDE